MNQSNPILLAIINGEADDSLDAIRSAIAARRQSLASINVAALHAGDTVRFSNAIRPKYLVGLPATVVKLNRESVVVNCPNDPAYGRFTNHRNVRCPNSLIEGLA